MLSSFVQRGSAVLRTTKVAKEVLGVPTNAPVAVPKASVYHPSSGYGSHAPSAASVGTNVIHPNEPAVAIPTSSSAKHRTPFSHHHHPRAAPITAKMAQPVNGLNVMTQTHGVIGRPHAQSLFQTPKPKVEFLTAPEPGAVVEFLAEDGSHRLGIVSQLVDSALGIWQVLEKNNQKIDQHHLPLSRITFYWPKSLTANSFVIKLDDLSALTAQVQLELENCRSQLALHYGKWVESKSATIRIENAAEVLFNGNPNLHQYYVTHRLLQESDAHVVPLAPTSGAHTVTEYSVRPLSTMSSLSKTYLQKQPETDHKIFLHRLARKIWATRSEGLVPLEVVSLETYVSQLPALSGYEKRWNLTWNPHKDAPFLNQLKAYAFNAPNEKGLHTRATLLDPLLIEHSSEAVFKLLVQIGVVGKYDNPFLARFSAVDTSQNSLHFTPLQMRDHMSKSASLAHVDRDMSFRRDYRNCNAPIFAIDGRLESAEIDDAIAVLPSPANAPSWVHIHIADPSRFVSPNDTLDNLARARVQSVFLPEKTATMFPPNYSRHHFSLLPNKPNYALTFAVKLDPQTGEILDYNITPSIIDKVTALTYDQADSFLASKMQANIPTSHLESLRKLVELGEARKRYREQAGARSFDDTLRPEIEVINNGETIHVNGVRDNESVARTMVKEFMLLVGEVTAMFAKNNHIPIPYRTQAKRMEKSLTMSNQANETNQLLTLTGGVAVAPPTSSQVAMSSSARVRYMPAMTSVEPAEHASLGLPVYCQASSPIRRYSDLLVHHQIKSVLRGEMPPFTAAKLSSMLLQLEETQGKLNSLANNSSRYWILRYLERQDPDRQFEALVTGETVHSMEYEPAQCVAWLCDLGWKTHISLHSDRLPSEGERIQVKIHRIDAFNDDVEFVQVGTEEDALYSSTYSLFAPSPASSPSL